MSRPLSQIQKSELLIDLLTEKGVRFHAGRSGWQTVSCFGASHYHGDRNPSASVNILKGVFRCHGCDLAGDAVDLVMVEEGLDFKQALAKLGGKMNRTKEEETWI